MITDKILAYAKKTYKTEPDYPFATAPSYPVLRHQDSRKWYALIMDVPRQKLGLSGEGRVDILNLKGGVLCGSLRMRPGILPAYHMNRDSWVSVLLDGTVPVEEVYPLLDISYELTSDKKRRTKPITWLVPANPKYYDIEAAIRQSPDRTFLWKQSSRVAVGDTVYIYVAAPLSAVKYKCRAAEVDISWRFADKNVNMTHVMRLKLVKTYRKPLGREVLRQHAVTTARGPRYMPESLIEELDGPGNQ